VSGVGRRMGVLDKGGDHRKGRGSFGTNLGVPYCSQWGLCCVDVQERRTVPKITFEISILHRLTEPI